MASSQLEVVSKQRSHPMSDSSRNSLINEWLTRFALNARIPLEEKERAVYLSMWKEGFADVETCRLQAAFVACLRSHTYKTMPTIGDVRQHLSKAEETVTSLEAEQKWAQVLAYAQSTSPDYPSRPVKIKEQTHAAIRAAGGLDWIRDCSSDDLQWAKKRFVETYTAWNALEKNQFLLPDGAIKQAFAELADGKQKQLTDGQP